METKVKAVLAIALLLTIAGTLFAMPGFGKGNRNIAGTPPHMNETWNGTAPWMNESFNATGMEMHAKCKMNATNESGCGKKMQMRAQDMNGTINDAGFAKRMEFEKGMPKKNKTGFANSTEIESLRQAVEREDYETAKGLNEKYGLGGAIFEKLNETTFLKFAQIEKLQIELLKELGVADLLGIDFSERENLFLPERSQNETGGEFGGFEPPPMEFEDGATKESG